MANGATGVAGGCDSARKTSTPREQLLATPGFEYSGAPIGGGEPAANSPNWKANEIQFYGPQVSNDALTGKE